MSRYPFVAVYILCSGRNGTLYVGVTRDLWRRTLEHKQGRLNGFARKHGCTRLVWFRRFHQLTDAIAFETSLKGWRRAWKLRAIEADNPEWRDLSDGWYDETTNRWLVDPDNP